MKQLTIEHNHGVYVLKDAEVIKHPDYVDEKYGRTYRNWEVQGTVVSGGVTNRLFHCTSFQAEPVGKVKKYSIWNDPTCVNVERDEWRVSNVFCG